MQLFQKFWFEAIFLVLRQYIGPKIDQNCKSWVLSIGTKIQNFEGFFKRCIFLIGRLPLVKFPAILNKICGSKAQDFPKRVHFMDAVSMQKTFQLHNQKCYTDETNHRYIS